jgi:hypothetical protein
LRQIARIELQNALVRKRVFPGARWYREKLSKGKFCGQAHKAKYDTAATSRTLGASFLLEMTSSEWMDASD